MNWIKSRLGESSTKVAVVFVLATVADQLAAGTPVNAHTLALVVLHGLIQMLNSDNKAASNA